MERRLFYCLCISLSFLLLACRSDRKSGAGNVPPGSAQMQPFPDNFLNSGTIRREIVELIRTTPDRTLPVRQMEEFYRNGTEFLWLGSFGVESQTDSLLACLENSSEHGLNPERFCWSDIQSNLKKLNNLHLGKGENINQLLARLEYQLTTAYLHYACGMNFGFVNPRRVLNNLEVAEGKDGRPLEPSADGSVPMKELYSVSLQTCDSAFLDRAINAAVDRQAVSFLQDIRPHDPGYLRLQAALAAWNKLPEHAFPEIPLIGDTLLRAGDRSRVVPWVAERLGMTGELPVGMAETGKDQVLTQTLLDAVNLFRKENGMAEDTSLGSLTIKALNRPVAYYKDRIRVNLERLRWKPRQEKGARYVVVNVASFRLRAIDSRADTMLEMKVCVGSNRNKTPLLSSTVRYMELNPYWNVPQSIIIREIIPSYKKDTTYFTRNRFKIYDKEGRTVDPHRVDWSKYHEGVPFDVKQDNKDGNSLGRMIFRFPNTHSVYLHDTPAKYGFRRDNRAISHGCVRLEKPLDFAYFLMGERDDRAADRIRLAVGLPALTEEGRRMSEKVGYKELEFYSFKPSVPLFMDYYTADVSNEGRISYWEDPYGYDVPLLKALDRQSGRSVKHAWKSSAKKR